MRILPLLKIFKRASLGTSLPAGVSDDPGFRLLVERSAFMFVI
jgi:hypothetical protein